MKEQYIVIKDHQLYNVELKVSNLLKNGYKTCGGISVCVNPIGNDQEYMQSVCLINNDK